MGNFQSEVDAILANRRKVLEKVQKEGEKLEAYEHGPRAEAAAVPRPTHAGQLFHEHQHRECKRCRQQEVYYPQSDLIGFHRPDTPFMRTQETELFIFRRVSARVSSESLQ